MSQQNHNEITFKAATLTNPSNAVDSAEIGAVGIAVAQPAKSVVAELSTAINTSAFSESVADALQLIRGEWQWLILGAIYLLGWYTPFTDHGTAGDGPLRWSWESCYSISFTLGFELYVPLMVAIVIWSRRKEYGEFWRRIVENYPPNHRKRQGSIYLFAFGCFLLFVAHIIQVKGVGVLALLLILVGAVYRVYGPLMTRALAGPLGLLIFTIPPPDHITQDLLSVKVTVIVVKLAAALLDVIGMHAHAAQTMLAVHGSPVMVNSETCAGSNIALSAILVLWTYHLCRRTDPKLIVYSFVIGTVIAYTLQILRVATIGVLVGPDPTIAVWLMRSSFVSFVAIAFTSWATLHVISLSLLDRAKVPHGVLRAARLTGRGLNTMTTPLDRIIDGFVAVGKWRQRSERALEKRIKSLLSKNKRQKRRW